MKLGYLTSCLWVTVACAQDVWSVQRLVAVGYPPLAQQARIQGLVELKCTVGGAGEVVECTRMSGHPLLQKFAIENAKKWRFRRQPANNTDSNDVLLKYEFVLFDGAPVRHRPNVEFSFEYPNHARIISQVPCPDHLPCTPEELGDSPRRPRSKSSRAIP